MMVIAYTDSSGTISLYSRRMDDLTEHFPHMVKAMIDLSIPPESILLFEAFMGNGDTHEELLEVQAIMRSKAARALDLQKNRGWMKFYLFRMVYWEGEFIENRPAGKIIEMMENTFTDRFLQHRDSRFKTEIYAIQPFEGSYDEALAIAEEEGYEGWVAYEKDEALGDRSFGFHGKPDRPKSCFKVKIDMEDDFVAIWDPENGTKIKPKGTWGTGKNKGRVGTLSLYQYGAGGKLYYICEVGSGLTDADREALADPSLYPIVLSVKFQSRRFISKGADSNALFLPRVAKFHEDKGAMECWNDELIDPDA
jgi:ATP-dependent DNA ligase